MRAHLPLNRLIYADDSGHPQSGLVVYAWIEIAPDRWSSVLKAWLAMRKRLWRDHRISIDRELHTTEYVNGRGRISSRLPDRHVHDGVEYWKDFGWKIALNCLETLRNIEGLSVGAVYRRAEPSELALTKQQAYAALVDRFEMELDSASSLGMVFMDGDGSDTSYQSTHRSVELDRRHVIEDAIHLDSKSSQSIQMADLVAWSANLTVDRHPSNEFAWDWYERFLAERDPNRRPQKF